MSRPTALYRWWDLADDLLYVGITTEPLSRTSNHGVTDPWWPQINTCTVEWYDDPEEAHAAELKAIAEENPRYNRKVPRRRATAEGSGNNRRRLEFLLLDWGLRRETGHGFRAWVEQRRPPDSDEKMPWYRVARELSSLTEVDVSPETVRRWYET